MQKIIIDDEFRFLLPTLENKVYVELEEDIIQNGCRDALVLWNGILIDGYNRYSICFKHNIPFKTVDMEFSSREDVLIWIIKNQIMRRNLTPIQLTHFRGVHYRAEKKSRGGSKEKSIRQNDVLKMSTSKQLAENYKVSPSTIDRDAKAANVIDAIGESSPEAKRMILAGDTKIDRKTLKELSTMSTDKLSVIGKLIEDGTFQKADYKKDQTKKIKEPVNHNLSKANELETLINKITSNFYINFQELKKFKASAEVKKTLRNHIDMLEEIYLQI